MAQRMDLYMGNLALFSAGLRYLRCIVLGSIHFSVPVRTKNLLSFFRGAASARSLSGRGIVRIDVAVLGVPIFRCVREHSFFPSAILLLLHYPVNTLTFILPGFRGKSIRGS